MSARTLLFLQPSHIPHNAKLKLLIKRHTMLASSMFPKDSTYKSALTVVSLPFSKEQNDLKITISFQQNCFS